MYTVQPDSALVHWRTYFIFTACIHVLSAVLFALLAASHRPSPTTSTNQLQPLDPQAPPTDRDAPPTAKPAAGMDVMNINEDDRSAAGVDSDAEYGSVSESVEAAPDSGDVTASGSLDTDPRDLHLAQLMESIL